MITRDSRIGMRRWCRSPTNAIHFVALSVVFTAIPDGRAAAQTSVSLAFGGPLQEPTAITRAQLFVTAWGVSEDHDLPVEGNVVRLDLEATRPEFAGGFADVSGFIYVKTAGYAPVMSEPFTWPAAGVPTVIDFRNGRRVTVAQGNKAALDVPLRHPLPRRVRLVDLDGRAVVGANVETAAYWQTPNHCGFLKGRDVLASGSTNEDGAINVPDIDGRYAFRLRESQMLFADANNDFSTGFAREGLITSLGGPETTLRVRRFQRERLAVDIVSNGKPVSGAVLWADMELGVCGAGYGPLATADLEGRIREDPFYAEVWTNYWVCAGKEQVWVLPHDGKLPARIDVGVTSSAERNAFADLCGK